MHCIEQNMYGEKTIPICSRSSTLTGNVMTIDNFIPLRTTFKELLYTCKHGILLWELKWFCQSGALLLRRYQQNQQIRWNSVYTADIILLTTFHAKISRQFEQKLQLTKQDK